MVNQKGEKAMTTTEKVNTNKKTTELEDVKINVKIKLSALWVTVMFLYVYADVRGFYETGVLEGLIAGELGFLQINQVFLLVSAIIMTIPSVMVFLSLTLKAKVNRWANIILGIIYTGIILATMLMPDVWAHYYFVGIVEVVLTALIVWYAWKWPKQEA
jgi:hypothetical protein